MLLITTAYAEAAGKSIKYFFGQTKWWFKKNNRGSNEELEELYVKVFTHDVLSANHVRKFSWNNRDYHRIYWAGLLGLEAEEEVKMCKMHGCALDTNYTFITEDIV